MNPIEYHIQALDLAEFADKAAADGKVIRALRLYKEACDLHMRAARELPPASMWKARCYYSAAIKAIMYGNYSRARHLCKLSIKYGTVETGATSYNAQSLILRIDEFLADAWAQPKASVIVSQEKHNVPTKAQRNDLDQWFESRNLRHKP